jgi:hypothetical protein
MNDVSPPTLIERLTRMKKAPSTAGGSDAGSFISTLFGKGFGGGGRSQKWGEPKFDETRATDFAITTVNVPDRLDIQEVRARAEDDYRRPGLFSFDRYLLGLWIRRLIWLGLLGGLGYWAYQVLSPIREDLSAARISQKLSQGAGFPIKITDTAYRITPSPRFVLRGVQLPGDITLDEVAIRLNWQDAWTAVRGGVVSLGEATVSPARLTVPQLWILLSQAPAATGGVPKAVSILRFESIELADAPLMKAKLEAVFRRAADGKFGPVAVAEAGGQSPFKATLTPAPVVDASPRFAFQFDATDWVLPSGPGLKWGEVVASGFASPKLLEIESYSLAGVYGVVQGAMYVATDLSWVMTGFARGTGLDIESIVASAGKLGAAKAAARSEGFVVPFAGTATMNLALVGRGDSFAGSLSDAIAAGPVQVRWAAINGVNLGYAAAHGGAQGGVGGGLTRFSELDASIVGGNNGVVLKDIVARAGAMATRGEVSVDSDLKMTGALRVDLGATRVQAPISVRVRGTLLEPQFGR